MDNPFRTPGNHFSPSGYSETIDTPGRLQRVKEFTADQLKAALALPDGYLQKTVRQAAERRLRKLQPFSVPHNS